MGLFSKQRFDKPYLAQVATAVGIEGARTQSVEGHLELAGTIRGMPLKLAIDEEGKLQTFELAYGGKLAGYDLAHDRDKPTSPAIFVSRHVYFDGDSRERDHAAFMAQPLPLRERIAGEIKRLNLRYFRSRERYCNVYAWKGANTGVGWLVAVIALAVEVAVARGATPPVEPAAPKPPPPRDEAAWAACEARAKVLAARLSGAAVTPSRAGTELYIRGRVDGAPMRFILDIAGALELDMETAGDGMVELCWSTDPADEGERDLGGGLRCAADQAAFLAAVPPALLAELGAVMAMHAIEMVWLENGVLDATLAEMTDDAAIAFAELLARLSRALT